MYVRIYEQIFGSSIMEERLDIRYVWFCVLALADKDGFIDMTIPAIARRINVDEPLVNDAITLFCAPDLKSRNSIEEGRRLIPMRDSFGWQVVNYQYYRDLKDQSARTEYMREYMRSRRANGIDDTNKCKDNQGLSGPIVNGKQVLTALVPTTTTTTSYSTTTTKTPLTPQGGKKAVSENFDKFWKAYPKKCNKGKAEKAWIKLNPNEQLTDTILQAVERAKTLEKWRKDNGEFIPYPSTWLNAKGWLDEISTPEDDLEAWGRKRSANAS